MTNLDQIIKEAEEKIEDAKISDGVYLDKGINLLEVPPDIMKDMDVVRQVILRGHTRAGLVLLLTVNNTLDDLKTELIPLIRSACEKVRQETIENVLKDSNRFIELKAFQSYLRSEALTKLKAKK